MERRVSRIQPTPISAKVASAPTRLTAPRVPGFTPGEEQYADSAEGGPSGSTSSTGLGEPHNNMQPYLAVNYIIAVEGVYPS